MAALNFKKQFYEDVYSGKKRRTIRKKRKYPIKAGGMLQLYTGLRTKYCEKIKEDVKCKKVSEIEMYPEDNVLIVDGVALKEKQRITFAKKDGFKKQDDFFNFFLKEYGIGKFEGVLITW